MTIEPRGTGPMSEASGPRSGRTVHDVELIRAYRLDHNLAIEHPFWTDDRILLAIHIGME